jgi:uncharacterized protein YlxW (UPF0749 family)
MATSDGSTRLRRSLVAFALAGMWWAFTATVAAQAAAQDFASDVETTGTASTAAEPGELADRARALQDAIDPGLDATVIVLPTPVDDVAAIAASLAATLGGPVVVVTPDGYAISATAPERTIVRDVAAAIVPSGVADDLASFMAQSNPSGMSWGISIVIPVLAVALLATGQRVGEYRAAKRSNATALGAEWQRLRARVDALADPVLELSTRVELDGRTEPARAYRYAASEYGHLRDALDRRPTAAASDGIRATLDDLERRFDDIEAMVGDR